MKKSRKELRKNHGTIIVNIIHFLLAFILFLMYSYIFLNVTEMENIQYDVINPTVIVIFNSFLQEPLFSVKCLSKYIIK